MVGVVGVDMRGLLLGLKGLVGVVWRRFDCTVYCDWGRCSVAGGAVAAVVVVVVMAAGGLAEARRSGSSGGGGSAGDGCGGGGYGARVG